MICCVVAGMTVDAAVPSVAAWAENNGAAMLAARRTKRLRFMIPLVSGLAWLDEPAGTLVCECLLAGFYSTCFVSAGEPRPSGAPGRRMPGLPDRRG